MTKNPQDKQALPFKDSSTYPSGVNQRFASVDFLDKEERGEGLIIGVYPGSFDPITFGHLDVIKRSLKLVDKLVIAVGRNSSKEQLFSAPERADIIGQSIGNMLAPKDLQRVEIKSFNGLLIDFAKAHNANMIIRGIRAFSDFDFEFSLAGANYKLCPSIETVFLITSENTQFISSRFVKEIFSYGGDISSFVPQNVIHELQKKYHQPKKE